MITQTKWALKALVEAQLLDWLGEADAKRNDGLTTAGPFAVYTEAVSALDGYPAVEIVPIGSDPTVDSYADIYRDRFAVTHSHAGDDEGRLQLENEAYMWALRQVFRNAHLAPPDIQTGPVDTGREEYTPGMRREGLEVPFVCGGFMDVTCPSVE